MFLHWETSYAEFSVCNIFPSILSLARQFSLMTLCRAFILYSGSLPRRTLCRLRLPENSDCPRCTSYCAGNCTPHVKSRHYLADKEEFDFILRIFLEKFREHFQERSLLNISRGILFPHDFSSMFFIPLFRYSYRNVIIFPASRQLKEQLKVAGSLIEANRFLS